jgi:hypothetical protein
MVVRKRSEKEFFLNYEFFRFPIWEKKHKHISEYWIKLPVFLAIFSYSKGPPCEKQQSFNNSGPNGGP